MTMIDYFERYEDMVKLEEIINKEIKKGEK